MARMIDDCSGLTTEEFYELLQLTMPYGKYAGRLLVNIPYEYYSWFIKKGVEDERLGKYMRFLCQAHLDGSIDMLRTNRIALIRSLEKQIRGSGIPY